MRIALSITIGLAMASTLFSQAQQPPAQGERGGRGGGRGAALEARIVTFEARPSSVRPGEPVVLTWATENPGGAPSIQPEVGPVTPRGTKQVNPTTTTTYTLALRGGVTKTVTVTVAGAPVARSSPPPSAIAANSNGRRMPDGKPDLTGVYNFAGLPAASKAPALKPGAEKFVIVRGPNDVRGRTTLGPDCKPLGIPQAYVTPYPFQFVQTAKLLVQIFEYPNAIRMIPIDGRPLPADPDPTWMGTGVGRSVSTTRRKFMDTCIRRI
jgi:uncharacterized protein YndB with AHSA1/START domain